MAFEKNDFNIPNSFKQRLIELMNSNERYNNPRRLAKELFKRGLISVNEKKYTPDMDEITEQKAFESIERTIRNHISEFSNSGVKSIRFEYIDAYCKFFKCSTDYLFGLTDIKTSNADIKMICDFTGLSESAIKEIIFITKPSNYRIYHNYELLASALNLFLENPMLFGYLSLLCDVAEAYHKHKEINPFEAACNKIPKKYLEDAIDIFSGGGYDYKKKPTKKLMDYVAMLQDADDEGLSTYDERMEAHQIYRACKYELDEKHRKINDDLIDKLHVELTKSSQ